MYPNIQISLFQKGQKKGRERDCARKEMSTQATFLAKTSSTQILVPEDMCNTDVREGDGAV